MNASRRRARSWPAAPAGMSSPALPWPRRCARAAGRVHWLGAPGGMEERSCRRAASPSNPMHFGGVRGKSILTLALLPARLLRAFGRASAWCAASRPDVVLGLGGYVTFPGGLMSVLLDKPLVLHEQNSVAGLANKVLASVADRVFTAFPGVLKHGRGSAIRCAPTSPRSPRRPQRFAGRSGPLRLLVVGGSLGARALNDVVPKALALHRAGAAADRHAPERRQADRRAARQLCRTPASKASSRRSSTTPRSAYAEADLILCRAGASTVTEIAAVGAAALFVPFPSAVDDHQTTNAHFLVDAGAALAACSRPN